MKGDNGSDNIIETPSASKPKMGWKEVTENRCAFHK